jgi:chromosome segregation ATPase
VALRDLNGEVVDLYFKVDRKSKKEKEQSYIYMMVSKGDEQFISSETEPSIFSSSTRFLNGFTEYGASYKMDVDIQNQDDAVQAAQKKYTRLREDEADFVKKIADLESKLKNNREQQETQLKVIEAEKKKLEDLRAKKQNAL